MEIQKFIESAVEEAVQAASNSSKKLGRNVHVMPNSMSIDISCVAESSKEGGLTLSILKAGADSKNSVVQKLNLSVYIESQTFQEIDKLREETEQARRRHLQS